MRRAHVSARNMRCSEERKTEKVPVKDTQNCSVPTFPSYRHCLETQSKQKHVNRYDHAMGKHLFEA